MLHRHITRIMLCTALALSFPCMAMAEQGSSPVAPAMPEVMQNMGTGHSSVLDNGTAMAIGEETTIYHNGKRVKARIATDQHYGLVLPDGAGSFIVVPGAGKPKPNPSLVSAREIKLQVRELASQLLNGLAPNYAGYIALPTSFVMQDDFERSSSFGRFISEQMFYEFNQRGLGTREYRLNNKLGMREDGEFVLARNQGNKALSSKNLYLVGTYYNDSKAILVNARLVRSDGRVVRSGQVVMAVNDFTRKMLASSGRRMAESGLDILDFNTEARPPEALSNVDLGLDIH